ncbi:ABC transporter ATP-binding protein [Methylomonas montana]|uniref:ABC transporter ATP-binding protein n=1 Tax=Methylomonas montana TaxID=3058963 RepID=UPI0026587542|nr:ABC transporter ATP-binding protein [Methylomonas montana]WKJ89243.1 ABC transporter ATP-binding protein [Methylomonas montana]
MYIEFNHTEAVFQQPVNDFSSSEDTLLEVRGLAKQYLSKNRTVAVFENIDLQVRPHEVVCLLGASGCGKSSLLTTLAGLQTANAGEIRFAGEALHKPDPRLGMMFQDPCLLPWLNVRQNISFGLTLDAGPKLGKAELKQKIETAMQWVGLQNSADAYPSHLSGGMAQRVSLARALVRNPDILLMDEPFSALDAITRLGMQELLLKLIADRRSAVVLVTHDIDEALILADRILLMGGSPGRIVKEWIAPIRQPRVKQLHRLIDLRMEILETLSSSSADAHDSEAIF